VVERVISLIRCSCAGGSVLRRARFDRPASEQVSARKERWAWGIISENRAWWKWATTVQLARWARKTATVGSVLSEKKRVRSCWA